MAKGSIIKLPNGTTIEISPNMTPDQITALVTAVTATGSIAPPLQNQEVVNQTGITYSNELTPAEIWQSSKREKVALFVRWAFSENLWFTAKEVLEEQLNYTPTIILGETSAIATYLARLFDNGYLDRQKSGSRTVKYRITDKLSNDYPLIEQREFTELITLEFTH